MDTSLDILLVNRKPRKQYQGEKTIEAMVEVSNHSHDNILVEVSPLWVHFFNKSNLPISFPLLKMFFSGNR